MNIRSKESIADVIFWGGDIITVDDDNPTAEALAIKNGTITAIGKRTSRHRCQAYTIVHN